MDFNNIALCLQAQERANQYKISGVTYRLTQGERLQISTLQHCIDSPVLTFACAGVVKNIIPAVASTNAVIAGSIRLLRTQS